ncbi:MAG: amino acid adenylation domain-containing protein [Verrucomicrobiales bacterium]
MTTIPLTQAQVLIWAGQCLSRSLPLYDHAFAIRIRGSLDRSRFAEAFLCTVASADALRSVLEFDEALASECSILPEPPEPCTIVTSSDTGDVYVWMQEEMRHSLDVARCWYRSVLVEIAADDYLWFFKVHHLAMDGATMRILFERQARFYENAELATDEPMPAFASYAAFEQAERLRPEFREVEAKWAEKIQASPVPCRFFRGRASEPATASTRVAVSLDGELSAMLRAVAALPELESFTGEMTLSHLFITAVVACISRIEDRDKFRIGTTFHNRATPVFRETAGLFTQIFPLEIDTSDAIDFAGLMQVVSAEAVNTLRMAKPGAVTAEMQKSFDVAVNFIPDGFGSFCGMPSEVRWLHSGHTDPHRRLSVHIHDFDRTGKFQLLLEFNDAAFDPEERTRFCDCLLATLRAFSRNPNEALVRYPLFGNEMTRALMQLSQGARVARDPERTLSRSIIDFARWNPERTAVSDESVALTFAELERVARVVSTRLIAAGVERGDLVAFIAGRSAVWVAGWLGILRSGAACVPIDPESPPERMKILLADCSPKAVLLPVDVQPPATVEASLLVAFPSLGELENTSLSPDFDLSRAGDCAYVLYTSGSTGEPRGVCVSHESVLNLVLDNESRVALPDGSRCFLWTNVSFDVSIYEIFTSLVFGHTLHIPPDSLRIDGEGLFCWLQCLAIASGYLPPFLLPALNAWLAIQGNTLSLRRLLVGVEPIPGPLLGSIISKVPRLKIINGYGPTEATVCATFSVITDDRPCLNGPAPVGTPLANTCCQVVDSHGNLLPLGAVGELWISGVGLAQGYLRPEATTGARFITSDLGGAIPAVERFYRTGDSMRWLDDGQLEFIGRRDEQLKIDGQRFEPGEIRLALLSVEGITQCAVDAQYSPPSGSPILTAYYVSRIHITSAQLRRELHSRLPPAMVPRYLVEMESLPATRSGKIDISALRSVMVGEGSVERAATPPGTIVEQRIAGILTDISGINNADVCTVRHFYELGLSSLVLMRLMSQVCRVFDVRMPLHAALTYPSICQLAAAVEQEIISEMDAITDEEAERMLSALESKQVDRTN